MRTATVGEILGKLKTSFLAKVDVDGGEIEVLRGYFASNILINNIIVELTPTWWSTWGYLFEQGAAVVTKLLETHNAHFIYWREASMVCCHSIFDVTPGIDWSSAPLGYVQRISADKLVPYLGAMYSPTGRTASATFGFPSRARYFLKWAKYATCVAMTHRFILMHLAMRRALAAMRVKLPPAVVAIHAIAKLSVTVYQLMPVRRLCRRCVLRQCRRLRVGRRC